MKIRKLIRVLAACLISGLGMSAIQPARALTQPQAVFQYAVFYNGLMEFTDCSPLTISGPVQCNSNIYVGCPSAASTLTFNSFVACSGTIMSPSWFGYSQASYINANITYNGTPSPGYGTNFSYVNLPIATNSYRELILPPPVSESTNNPLSVQRYYNKAGLVITVSNASINVLVKGAAYDGTPLVFSNLAPANTPGWTNWNQANFAYWLTTNSSFYDAREMRTNHVTQIDIGHFGAWIATNTNVLAKWNPSSPFNGIIYVADFRTTNSMYMDAVRLTNAQTIPSIGASNVAGFGGYTFSGLTVATVNPLYIHGLYNCPAANVSSTNTSGTQPCSVICDALTLLSPAWVDAASFAEATAGPVPVAAADTVNTAIIAGNVPSTGNSATQFSGGVQNLPRLLENWAGDALWLNTSLVNLYPSAQATKQFLQPSLYYSAPTRHFTFDQNLNNIYNMPPGTPFFSPPTASLMVLGLSQQYNGTPRPVEIITAPSNLNVTVTYNGSSNAPINVGNYQVITTVVDPVYIGSATNTLVVSNGIATVTISNLSQVYDGTQKHVSFSTAPSGLPGSITYNGNLTPPTFPGTYSVIVSVNTSNYIGGSIASLVIAKAPASVVESNLSQVYDGTAKPISITTVPPGLVVDLTYNGSTDAPTNAGSYTVMGTVNDLNYNGSATNTLVISSPAPTPISLTGLSSIVDGSFQLNFTNTPGLGFSVLSTADPSQSATNWDFAGSVVEVAPGQYQFIDTEATNSSQQFYIIRSP